jgi:hypothetical protein
MTTLARAALFAILALPTVAGCSSSSGATEYCSLVTHPVEGMPTATCEIDRNIPSSIRNSLMAACEEGAGTFVSSCPTEGLIGCCSVVAGAATVESCYFEGDAGSAPSASALEASCAAGCPAGSWSTSQ